MTGPHNINARESAGTVGVPGAAPDGAPSAVPRGASSAGTPGSGSTGVPGSTGAPELVEASGANAAPDSASHPDPDPASASTSPSHASGIQATEAEVSEASPAQISTSPATDPQTELPDADSFVGEHTNLSAEDTTSLHFPKTKTQNSNIDTGSTTNLVWGARSDIGLTRDHNEDSFLVRAPLFCVCDGMGGHEAGEVASAIAVHTIAKKAPTEANDTLLGAAVEAANHAIIEAVGRGEGKPGMGCTATAALIEGARISIAHVGDSRVYIMHAGNLVRVTHDHSFVEELVDAGEITPDEARTHPSRSVITRALGSDPDMYADHFTLSVTGGDRIVLCSDGLSSMIPDSEIEALCLTSTTPQNTADRLVQAALDAGGHDNVSVLVVDVVDDTLEEQRARKRARSVFAWVFGVFAIVALIALGTWVYVSNSWYLGNNNGKVSIYQGINANFLGLHFSGLHTQSKVSLSELPEAIQQKLASGIPVASLKSAQKILGEYAKQAAVQKEKTDQTAASAKQQSQDKSAAQPTSPVATLPDNTKPENTPPKKGGA